MDKYSDDQYVATVSVVVPVYQGEKTISTLVSELAPYVDVSTSPSGIKYVINEVLLVHDSGPDNSANVINDLSTKLDWVRPVWLSRNF